MPSGIQLPRPVFFFLLFSSIAFWGSELSTIVIGPVAIGSAASTTIQKVWTDGFQKNVSTYNSSNDKNIQKVSTAGFQKDISTYNSSNDKNSLRLDIVKMKSPRFVGPEVIWDALLKEGTVLLEQKRLSKNTIVMEVGMNRAVSCLQAAQAGFEAHCFEPSPASYQVCLVEVKRYERQQKDGRNITGRVHIYNAAAGSKSNGTIHFLRSKSTGAHVIQEDELSKYAKEEVAEVPMMRLDDVVSKFDGAFLIKVDVQGFEPEIFRGLSESIANHKVQYMLLEYWPRGMDRMASSPDANKFQVSVQLLKELADAGYTLFQLKVQYHPGEPWGNRTNRVAHSHGEYPPAELVEHCQWFYDMEEQLPFAYHHGYWTDIFAVAPGSMIPENPLTTTGYALKQLRNASALP